MNLLIDRPLTLELVLKSSLITICKCNQDFTSSTVSLGLHCLLAPLLKKKRKKEKKKKKRREVVTFYSV